MFVRAVLAAAVTLPSTALAVSPPPLQFQGTPLGTPLQAWLQKPFGDPSRPRVRPVCAKPSAGAPSTVCRYVARYGAITVGESFPLVGRYRARDVRYRFSAGRLSEVDFSTSSDGFDLVMARLKRRYGQPVQVLRDTAAYPHDIRLPRVRAIWRTPGGRVELIDPAASPTRMTVRLVGASPRVRAAS
jgi:hypothetical protein